MPELPDVEVFKQYLEATALHKTIEKVSIHSPRIVRGLAPQELARRLEGRRLESARRHGKYLFARMDDGHWLVLHFGMTGFLKYFKKMDREPPHDRLLLEFANGYHLAYDCQRLLGEVSVTEDADGFVAERKLGPDALDSEVLDLEHFKQRLRNRRGMVKPALMNQEILAGVGNVYSDEILFQARIHPRTKLDRLSEETLAGLYENMHAVLQTAIDRRAIPQHFPSSYLTPRREGGACPRCGHELQRMKVSGRTAAYCPRCQGVDS